MEFLKTIKAILWAPADRLVLLVGAIFVLLAIVPIRYEHWQVGPSTGTTWLLLSVGMVLIGLFVWRSWPSRLGKASVEATDAGFVIRFSSGRHIRVCIGRIQDCPAAEHSAIVLPANTSFDCKLPADHANEQHTAVGPMDHDGRQLRARMVLYRSAARSLRCVEGGVLLAQSECLRQG